MDSFLDTLWLKIEVLIEHARTLLETVFAPLNALGPAGAIFILAFLTVLLTRLFSGMFNTKRYRMLEGQFRHWYNLRQEANSCEDPEKAKLLKRNIDQAELNRVYYDYFFEGLMKSLLTRYLPIFLMLAYINETYRSDRLMADFGRAYVFKVAVSSGEPIIVGAVFWFFVSILLAYGACFFIGKIISKVRKTTHPQGKS